MAKPRIFYLANISLNAIRLNKISEFTVSFENCRSRSAGFSRSQLIRIYTVFNSSYESMEVNGILQLIEQSWIRGGNRISINGNRISEGIGWKSILIYSAGNWLTHY